MLKLKTDFNLIKKNHCSLQSSIVGAMAISDLVKTTLGPKGMVSII